MDSLVSISQINDTVFKVNISAKTVASGYYVLTVQTAGITDLVGHHGKVGKQVSWIQTISMESPTISGPDTICEGTSGVKYVTERGMTNYTWVVSSGGTITAGAGTDTITVRWDVSGPQTVSIKYTNANGNSTLIPTIKESTF